MKISQKLIVLFLPMVLIPVLVIGVVSYTNTQRALNHEILAQIDGTLKSQTTKINDLIAQDRTFVSRTAGDGQIQVLQARYAATHSPQYAQQLSAYLSTVQLGNQSIRRLYVIGNNGIVAASSDPRLIGKDYSRTKVFQAGRTAVDVSMFFNDIDGVEGQYMTAPVTVNIPAQTIGVLVIEHEVYDFSFITSDYTDLGSTGETFMTGPNAEGQTVNLLPLRFDPQAGLKSDAVHGSGVQIRSYRNQLVLAKTVKFSSIPWSAGVMIDQAEVYAPVIQLRNITIAVIAITAVVVGLIGWYAARYITIPIKRMTAVVTKIRQGDLSLRVDAQSKDEIGLLGTSFNDMKESLVETQARLEASIGSLPFGFAIIDRQNQIVFHNAILGQLVNRDIPAQPSASVETLKQISRDYASALDILGCIHDSQAKRQIIEKNVEIGPKFFRLLFIPVINSVGKVAQVVGCVMLMEDTSEKKALERSRDEFFSIASHELRTPLTAVRGNAGMIMNFYKEQLEKDADLKDMVRDIHESSTRLISIVNDFLDMSRLEQGRFVSKKEPCDVGNMIERILREYDVTGSRRKLYLKFDRSKQPLPMVMTDPDRARQIIVNLIGNSLKFTEKGGVTVTAVQKDQMVKISVTDTGKGIPVESQHLLFHKFQQASNNILTRDSTQSTGLGLYISKLLAESMNGRLYIEHTEVNKGSTFSLELPITNETPAAVSADSGSPEKPVADKAATK